MLKSEALEKKAKAVYHFKFGCLGITGRKNAGGIPPPEPGLQEALSRLFISNSLVREVNKQGYFYVSKLVIGEPIGARTVPEAGLEIQMLNKPIGVHMNYSLASLDPDVISEHKIPDYEVNTILLYDGFLYLIGMKDVGGPFNYQRHAARLHKWLHDLVTQQGDWEPIDIPRSPFLGIINLYLLEEEEEGIWHAGIDLESSHGTVLNASYTCGIGESIDDGINLSATLLHMQIRESCIPFYSAQKLVSMLDSANTKAAEMVANVTDEYLAFYNINFFNILRKFNKCIQLGKGLSEIYALMPNIEKLEREYQANTDELINPDSERDELETAFANLLQGGLYKLRSSVFTRGVNEMLHQEVSDMRAHLNYQLLLLTAIIAFIAVILAARL